jgi:hypothetical protein
MDVLYLTFPTQDTQVKFQECFFEEIDWGKPKAAWSLMNIPGAKK